MDPMDALTTTTKTLLVSEANGRQVIDSPAEPWSWAIEGGGSVHLSGPADEPSLVAQRTGGDPYPIAFDPGDRAAHRDTVRECLAYLG